MKTDTDIDKVMGDIKSALNELAGNKNYRSAVDFFDIEAKKLANQFRDDLKNRIEEQQFDWPKLSAVYLKHKKKLGLDERILIARGDYVRSIRSRRMQDMQWIVEIPPTLHYSGLTYRELSLLHEYGSEARGIPARASWGPVISEYKNRGRKTVQELLTSFGRQFKNGVKASIRPSNYDRDDDESMDSGLLDISLDTD
jgi:hypothetical protein